MNLPEVVRPVFDALPRRLLRDTQVAAFDTSYKMSWWLARFTAARKLDRKLRELGGKRSVLAESFFVEEREGPLYEDEIERARACADQPGDDMLVPVSRLTVHTFGRRIWPRRR
jgi:hypothetical protein